MYQSKCSFCDRVHSAKKVDNLPQICQSCHAALPAPEWIDDDETDIDDIKDALRAVLSEQGKKNNVPTQQTNSEPTRTKEEKELIALKEKAIESGENLKEIYYYAHRNSIAVVESGIKDVTLFNGEDEYDARVFYKIVVSVLAAIGVLALLYLTDRLEIASGVIAFFLTIPAVCFIPFPFLHKKQLLKDADEAYEGEIKKLPSYKSDYEISCKKVMRYASENRTQIRKSVINAVKEEIEDLNLSISKQETVEKYKKENVLEKCKKLCKDFYITHFIGAVGFAIGLFLSVFLLAPIEHNYAAYEETDVPCVLVSKDINDSSLTLADGNKIERTFRIKDSDTFWNYTVGDSVTVHREKLNNGDEEYSISSKTTEGYNVKIHPVD